MFFLYSGNKSNFGVVPPLSMAYANIDGYTSELLAEDMLKKAMAKTLKCDFPHSLHYFLHGKNNYDAYLKLLHMTSANFENSNQNTAYGR